MNVAALNAVLIAWILGADPPAEPKAFVLEVGLVSVAPHRPGTDKPWDSIDEAPRTDGCDVLQLAPGGKGLSTLCDLAAHNQTKVEKHDPTDPDIFIRVVAGPGVSYRSNTVANTVRHVFSFSFVVPAEVIPQSGIEVYVQDDDSSGTDETQENIGLIRLRKTDLVSALNGNGLLRLDDKQGGLDRIEIKVSAEDDQPRQATQKVNVRDGIEQVEGFEVHAGEAVEIQASGTYEIGKKMVSSAGVSTIDTSQNLGGAPFARGQFGAGVALVGMHRAFTPVMVAPCALLVARHAGPVFVGVNDRQHRGAGDLSFEVTARAPSAAEWRQGKADGKCQASVASATDAKVPTASDLWVSQAEQAMRTLLQANGEEIAKDIQHITHPTGGKPQLGEVAFERRGDTLAIHIHSLWTGGVLGGKYDTAVLWEVNERRHIRAVVERDTAAIHVAKPNAQQLDRFFETTLYPKLQAQ